MSASVRRCSSATPCVLAVLGLALGPVQRVPAAEKAATYLAVPVKGNLRKAVHADGLKASLGWASQNPRIEHVVLHIASGGGSVEAARAMVALVRGERKRFTFHAFVERAVGPAAAVALACDTLHMAPKGSLGGAGLGSEEARALGREAAAVAQEKKQPALLVQAVLGARHRLCGWVDDEGGVHIDAQKPRDLATGDLLVQHAGSEPLMLSAAQAVGLRLADGKADSVAALGQALALDRWHSVGDYAVGVMRRLRMNEKKRQRDEQQRQERIAKNHKRRQAVMKVLEASKQEAIQNDPRRFDYALERDPWDGDLEMTGAARLQWARNTEAAMAAWNRVQQAVREMVRLEKEARALGAEPLVDETTLRYTLDRASREIHRLRREKHTSSPVAGPFGPSDGVREWGVRDR